MPILGILASQISGHLLGPASYDSIATITVGSGGATTVDFTSITSSYKHLQVRYLARSGRSRTANSGLVIRLNGSYGTYSHIMNGDGASATASGGVPSIGGLLLEAPGVNATGGIFGVGVIDLLDYASGNKPTTMRALSGVDCNGSGRVSQTSQWLNSNTAISRITFETVDGGTNIQEYSHFALYGIKG